MKLLSVNNEQVGREYTNASISLLPEDLKALDLLAKRKNATRSQLVREALALYFAKVLNEPLVGVVRNKAGEMIHTGLVRDNEMLHGIEIGELILEPLD